MTTTLHSLYPLPQRLAGLLVKHPDRHLAAKVETWMARHSNGLYSHLHTWLDDDTNVELRKTLGTQACEIIESEELGRLEE